MSMEQEVKLAKQGDREAFIRLTRQIENGLYNTARAMVKKDEDIADALQETILKAYKSLDTLREPGFFKTWVYRILINECNRRREDEP
ncbi:sigma factor [Paenibacillus zanthoxyli]|uniref:sigma factor n=1 Tax=Paenibacillus zanthoxyli TaxID=369399 RepID=UPI0004714178|nr:sigma factor [Paenibacillus zanthoxyli]